MPPLQDTLAIRQCVEAAIRLQRTFGVQIRVDNVPEQVYSTTMFGLEPVLQETAAALWEKGVQISQLAAMGNKAAFNLGDSRLAPQALSFPDMRVAQ